MLASAKVEATVVRDAWPSSAAAVVRNRPDRACDEVPTPVGLGFRAVGLLVLFLVRPGYFSLGGGDLSPA
jgi:hypothetical protein